MFELSYIFFGQQKSSQFSVAWECRCGVYLLYTVDKGLYVMQSFVVYAWVPSILMLRM